VSEHGREKVDKRAGREDEIQNVSVKVKYVITETNSKEMSTQDFFYTL
jgi:hypothetical protein